MASSSLPVSRGQLIAVGLTSGTLLMTELALTRIFSVVMYYHFAFLAISIALFGLSASGVFAYVVRRRARPPVDRHPARLAGRRLRRLHADRAFRAGAPAGRPQLLAREPRADADDLRAGGPALLHRRAGHHAGDLAARVARQCRLRIRSARRGRRLPHPDPAPRSRRCARRRPDGGGARADRSCAVRPGGEPGAVCRRRRRDHGGGARRSAVGHRGLRRSRHEGTPGRHRPVQQVEFVFPNRRLRTHPRRLVAESQIHRRVARHAVHGHRFGGLHAHPPRRAGLRRTSSTCATS